MLCCRTVLDITSALFICAYGHYSFVININQCWWQSLGLYNTGWHQEVAPEEELIRSVV